MRLPLRVKVAAFALVLIVAVTASPAAGAYYFDRALAADRLTWFQTLAGVVVSGGAVDLPRSIDAFARNADEVAMPLAYVVVTGAEGVDSSLSRVNATYLHEVDPGLAATWSEGGKGAVLASIAKGQVRELDLHEIRIRLRTGEVERLLQLGFSLADVHRKQATYRLLGLLSLAFALAVGVGGAFALSRPITRPVQKLAFALAAVGRGDLEQEVVASGNDEITDLARAYESMRLGLREGVRVKGTLARYVSGEVAERLLSERSDLDLAGELREVTVLFLDVRGFTSLSERLPAAEVVRLLNEYFDLAVQAIAAEGGTINKFIGDSILAIWGAPRSIDEPEWRAVRAAVAIQEAAAERGAARRLRNEEVLAIGIGINSGKAVAGNIGAQSRMEYTVIGDSVNLAQRLEGIAGPGQILISPSTLERVTGRVLGRLREPVKLKGRTELVAPFEVRALAGRREGAA